MIGWIDIMESCADIRGKGLQPTPWSNGTIAVIYFTCFNVVVNLFLMKLFVGVMAASFSNANGTSLTTEHQKCVRIQLAVQSPSNTQYNWRYNRHPTHNRAECTLLEIENDR